MRSYRLKYTGIRVKDMDESLRFYTGVLGMEVVDKREPTPPTKGEVVTLRSPGGDQLLELNWYAEGSRFGLPYVNGEELDHLSFDVDDLDGAIAELSRKGVEVVIRPCEIGGWYGWREAFVKDPNGIWIELLQSK
ncbi:MAG TPA: VOC family protein [Thermoplasmata archaeon]